MAQTYPASRRRAALVIPALNEAAVIGETLGRIPKGLFELVIVADNGSTDGTAEKARAAGALVTESERGYGAACLKAMDAIPEGIEAVVFMQADGSEDPLEAGALLAPIYDGRADLTLGSRVEGWREPWALLPHQRFGNWLAVLLIRWIHGYRYSDLGPFRAIRWSSLRVLGMRDLDYGWTVEMQVRAVQQKLRVEEIAVRYGVRRGGENKVSGNLWASLSAGVKILWTVCRLAISRA
jgi:glycosyltransferase involved in cell wall biosynthesis